MRKISGVQSTWEKSLETFHRLPAVYCAPHALTPGLEASPWRCWTCSGRRCRHSWWLRCTTCPEATHPECLPLVRRRALPTGEQSRCPAARRWGTSLQRRRGLTRSLWRLMWHQTTQPALSSSPPCSNLHRHTARHSSDAQRRMQELSRTPDKHLISQTHTTCIRSAPQWGGQPDSSLAVRG